MTKRILVVDPHEPIREVVAEMLKEAGYFVQTVESPKAMRWLADARETIDLVIIDASISQEQNAPLALHLKNMRVPMVMMSGNPNMIKYATEKGMLLLRKPFKMTALLDAVQRGFDIGVFGQREERG